MIVQEKPAGASRYPRQIRQNLSLLVNETFLSIQGEGPEQGYPTFFIRLAGCNLRCSYCDTTYAYFEGKRRSISELVDEAARSGAKAVLVTGGEPLAQASTPHLCQSLRKAGRLVSVETNGSFPTSSLPKGVRVLVDVKTPGSGEEGSFSESGIWENLKRGDALKFVLRDADDYSWAREFLSKKAPPEGVEVILSPVWGELDPRSLGEWLIRDSFHARMQVQLHKILWGDRKGA